MNRQSITVVTAEENSPVSLNGVKNYLRLDGNNDDSIVQDFIDSAIDSAKNYTRRSFINRTLKLTLDRFPLADNKAWWGGVRQISQSEIQQGADSIELPYPPLVSVTSIVTYDDDNASSTFDSANYLVDTAGGRIVLNRGSVWPTDLRDYAAIEVTYISGYGTSATDIPSAIRTAINMHIQEMYENREFCEMPDSCKDLLRAYRINDGLTING